jgi:hypothetical protein
MHNTKLIKNEIVLTSNPKLIEIVGRAPAALLGQLEYWMTHENVGVIHDGKKWIYNTAEEWAKQIAASTATIERILKKLKDAGLISIKKLHSRREVRTNYITLNMDEINRLLSNEKPEKTPEKPSHPPRNGHSIKSRGASHQTDGILYTKITNKDYLNNKSEKNFEKNNFVTDTVGQGTTSPTTPEEKRTSLEEYQAQETTNPTEISKASPEVPSKAPLETNEDVQKTTPQPTIVQDMMREITSELPTLEAKLTKDIAKCLVAAFKTKFDNDLNRFAHYLKRIKSSKYLMGEGFKLTLNWILSYKTIDRILNGELGVTLAEYNVPKDLESIATTHIDTQSESDIAKKIRQRYKSYFGADMYTAWMMQVIIHTQDTRVVIEAPSRFVKDRVQQHVDQLIWAMR